MIEAVLTRAATAVRVTPGGHVYKTFRRGHRITVMVETQAHRSGRYESITFCFDDGFVCGGYIGAYRPLSPLEILAEIAE